MDDFFSTFSAKDWESFCEVMLRQHFGSKNFHIVPDEDQGDLGIEFFTTEGTIYQCYFPEPGIEMKKYKRLIQIKINDDLKKLKENEKGIKSMLDDITIHQWVLLTPEYKSKELIPYCNKKKKEVIDKNISYIKNNSFIVKIETAKSFPDAKLYAQGVYNKAINIPLANITSSQSSEWLNDHTEFSENINRKSTSLMGSNSEKFKDNVAKKYIQIEKFLDQLRLDHPDLHSMIENTAMAQLQDIQDNSLFESKFNQEFLKKIVDSNKRAFDKHSKYMSDTNMQSLSFGYLSKWIAECYMDFES